MDINKMAEIVCGGICCRLDGTLEEERDVICGECEFAKAVKEAREVTR